MNAPLSTYTFQNRPVRVAGSPEKPLFCAADVCSVLEIQNPTQAVAKLDADERAMFNIGHVQGETNFVTESGLYTLILRCRDAVTPGTTAHAFRKWVTAEVLPAIRKTGAYLKPGVSSLDMAELVCKALREQEHQIAEVRALAIQANSYNSSNTGFFTVRAFANIHGFRLSLAEAKGIGKKAANLCRQNDITMGRARDELFGEVNSYPVEVLEDVFDAVFQKGGNQ